MNNFKPAMISAISAITAIALAIFVFWQTVWGVTRLYVDWAVRKYPDHNSMASLGGFFYGVLAGAIAAVLVILIVYKIARRFMPNDTKHLDA